MKYVKSLVKLLYISGSFKYGLKLNVVVQKVLLWQITENLS